MKESKHVHTSSQSEPLSQVVIYAVADAKGVDPMDLDECLYDCIDPDALDRLFTSGHTERDTTLTFSMSGCRVDIENGDTVVVTPAVPERRVAEAKA